MRRPTRRTVLSAGFGAVAMLGTGAAGVAEAATTLAVTDYAPQLPRWPRGRTLTIAVVADLHAGGPNMGLARIETIVARTNAFNADLIVLLGDYVATHRFVTKVVPYAAWAGALGQLRAPLGVFAILGNHDWWHDMRGIVRALRAANIPVLENDVVHLGAPGRRFWLAGLGDQLAFRLRRNETIGVDDLPGTLHKITTDDPVILLAHEPDIFVRVPRTVALTLCGHTHGGQVRVPLLWPQFVPSRYGARFAYGHIVEEGRHLIVSGGLGTSILPVRLGVTPEIVRITLR